MKAIETSYKGYRFRSRIEARWAVFFDALGVHYEYEKEGYDLGARGRYLPDFWLPCPGSGKSGLWVEVKGAEPTQVEILKMDALCHQTGHRGYLVWGDGFGHGSWHVVQPSNLVEIRAKCWCAFHHMLASGYPELWWKEGDSEERTKYQASLFALAAVEARSARFEYGQTRS